MPESPRWLISKGRDTQALQTLAYYHADGDENNGLVRYEFEEIKAAIEFDRTGTWHFGHFNRFFADWFRSCLKCWVEGPVLIRWKQEAHADHRRSCLLLAVVW